VRIGLTSATAATRAKVAVQESPPGAIAAIDGIAAIDRDHRVGSAATGWLKPGIQRFFGVSLHID
jgi:hypothetical protein